MSIKDKFKTDEEKVIEYLYLETQLNAGDSLYDDYADLIEIIALQNFEKKKKQLDSIKKEYDKIKVWYKDALKFSAQTLSELCVEDPTNIAFIMALKKKENPLLKDEDIFIEVIDRLKTNKRYD